MGPRSPRRRVQQDLSDILLKLQIHIPYLDVRNGTSLSSRAQGREPAESGHEWTTC